MNAIIKGNILDIKQGIICHQVNCKKVAGAGLARQIKDKYPNWYKNYLGRPFNLGDTFATYINDKLIIFDIYSQDNFGTDKRYTNYAALGHGLIDLKNSYDDGRKIYIPHGIGCGLGGGDWNIVSQIIYDALPNAILVKFEAAKEWQNETNRI